MCSARVRWTTVERHFCHVVVACVHGGDMEGLTSAKEPCADPPPVAPSDFVATGPAPSVTPQTNQMPSWVWGRGKGKGDRGQTERLRG